MLKNLAKKSNSKGFTLVELIIVIVIIAVLAAIAIPSVSGYIERANTGRVLANGRSAFMATCTVVADNYAKGITSTTNVAADAKTLANVIGTITPGTIDNGTVTGDGWVYTEPGGYTVTFAAGVFTVAKA